MTNQQINIAITWYLGAKPVRNIQTGDVFLTFEPGQFSHSRHWQHPDSIPAGEDVYLEMSVPNYAGDLNAMNEVELTLPDDDFAQQSQQGFRHHLLKITGSSHKSVHATALQRAEAFLRTLGLWQEEPKSTTAPDSVSVPQ